MKKVLGLDLGVGSIGWCLVEKDDNNTPTRILRMGSRIVPISSDEETGYTKGNAISKNADRTAKRTARKCYDRYQLRRQALRAQTLKTFLTRRRSLRQDVTRKLSRCPR